LIEDLLYALDECFDGEGRDGGIFLEPEDPGLFSILDALSAEEASLQIGETSVANHVYHLIFAIDVFIGRVTGDAGRVDWSASWRERPLNDAEWAGLKKDLAGRREKAVSLARERGARFPRLALGLLTHTVFHLGLVRMKSDALRAR